MAEADEAAATVGSRKLHLRKASVSTRLNIKCFTYFYAFSLFMTPSKWKGRVWNIVNFAPELLLIVCVSIVRHGYRKLDLRQNDVKGRISQI